jgi:hypothetical protein
MESGQSALLHKINQWIHVVSSHRHLECHAAMDDFSTLIASLFDKLN